MVRTLRKVERTVIDDDTPVVDRREIVEDSDYTTSSIAQIISVIGGIILSLLSIRFLLSLLGANRTNAFADLIYTLTHPFVSPFFGLFNYQMQYGLARFEVETLVAIAVYGLLTWVLARAVSVGQHHPA